MYIHTYKIYISYYFSAELTNSSFLDLINILSLCFSLILKKLNLLKTFLYF